MYMHRALFVTERCKDNFYNKEGSYILYRGHL